jgi:hypothetical protein
VVAEHLLEPWLLLIIDLLTQEVVASVVTSTTWPCPSTQMFGQELPLPSKDTQRSTWSSLTTVEREGVLRDPNSSCIVHFYDDFAVSSGG